MVDFTPSAPTVPIDTAWFRAVKPLPPPAIPGSPPIEGGGSIALRLTYPQGDKPVVGAEVRLTPSATEWPNARVLAPRTARTGVDGRVTLAHLPRIQWMLSAIGPHAVLEPGVVDLRAQAQHKLERWMLPTVAIHGHVLDPAGRAAAGVHIQGAAGRGLDAVSDRNGRFVLHHAIAGLSQDLYAMRDDGAAATARVEGSDTALPELTVQLRAADDASVIHVRVVDEAGAPLGHVRINLSDMGLPTETDAHGTLSLEVPRQQASLEATLDGYQRSVLQIDPTVAALIQITLQHN